LFLKKDNHDANNLLCDMREQALAIFNAAVSAVQPSQLLPENIAVKEGKLQLKDHLFLLEDVDHIYVIGAGKAAVAMVLEIEKILGEYITKGVVATKYDHCLQLKKIKCIEAGHPVPDENSVKAGKEILDIVSNAKEKDIVISLISGGASALMADHPPGTTLSHLQHLFELLLHSGATISEMNTVRKHLSFIKGGQLSKAAYPAILVSFILSDVIGDPLDVIASGPTAADASSFQDAYSVLKKYGLLHKINSSIIDWLQKGLNKEIEETPKPGANFFKKTFNYLIGTNLIALEAAAIKAKQLGFTPFIITDKMSGEVNEESKKLVHHLNTQSYSQPTCLLMGGETTVTIKGKGKGGRNQQFVLAALNELMRFSETQPRIPLILSAGTDGSDGPTDATGAMVDEETIKETKALGLDVSQYLDNNDAYNFFTKVGGHIITGATQTNVMDIVIVLM
jgi:glycerate 2-kinase